MRELLFIARVFPPQGGGGVQRPAKLARYLTELGWRTRVIAAPPIGPRDDDLLRELPPQVQVTRLAAALGVRVPQALATVKMARVHGMIRRLTLLGDDGFADLMETVALGVRVGAGAKAVLATSLPFSSVVAGALIARTLRLPFVADLRDPWAHAPKARAASRGHLTLMRALEDKVLASADAVVTVTESYRHCLASEVAERALVIPNGFDSADLSASAEPRSDDRFRIVYAGTLYGSRRPGPILEAVARAQARTKKRIDLVFAGVAHEHRAELQRASIPVELRGYLSHRDTIALLRSADAILVLVGDQPEDDHSVPAKLYEALALQRPVLCWARDESEAAKLMRAVGAGRALPDARALELALLELVDARTSHTATQEALAPYERRAIAQRFAELLDRIARV